MSETYVHGYDPRENERLHDQAGILATLLHSDTSYPAGARVLEAGCGVGAQTLALALGNPETQFICIDISKESLAEAKRRAFDVGVENATFEQGDIFALPFEPNSFDHVFICFVLEHLSKPVDALVALKSLVKPGGSITVIEGDHGSTYFHPDSAAARAAVECQIALQRTAGGNALIGRQIYPLMLAAGLDSIHVSPRTVYVDASRPDLVDGFTKNTFTAMIEGIRESAIAAGLIEPAALDEGIRDLQRTAEGDGVFCYSFFKGIGTKKS